MTGPPTLGRKPGGWQSVLARDYEWVLRIVEPIGSVVLGQVIEAKTAVDMRSLDRAVAAARSSTLATAVV